MVITQPTVDDFSDTTVMRVIRKIVNYICNDLVDGINNNDIVSGHFSVQGNQLSGTLTKGNGTTIDIPAATLPSGGGGSDNPYPTAVSMTISGTTLNFNMTMSNSTPITGSVNLAPILEGYATDDEVTEMKTYLQEQITAIKPTVTVDDSVSPPTISVAVNGSTSTTNLPSSGGPTLEIIEEADLKDIQTICSKLFSLNIGDTFAVVSLKLTSNAVINLNGTMGGSVSSPIKEACVSGQYHSHPIAEMGIRQNNFYLSYFTADTASETLTINDTNYRECARLIIHRYS